MSLGLTRSANCVGGKDDGQSDARAEEVWGGPNPGHSLAQARRNFVQFLVMYEPEQDRRVGGPDGETERTPKQALIGSVPQTR
jgi:hypothetical protein